MKYANKQEVSESLEHLRKWAPPGTTVYTVLRRVSRSGMSRLIDLYVIRANKPVWLSFSAARVLGYPQDHRSGALKVGGCGMDMGFHLVNSLSYKIHGRESRGDGVKPEAEGRLFTPRRGHFQAGYSLKHEWI